jgi:ferrous iron transport protein B
VILAISIILWALATFPRAAPSETGAEISAQTQLENSFAGRLGKFIEPVLAPLGFDWQIGIGVVTSFAAREVIVSTLAIVYGVGSDAADENPDSLYDTLRNARRTDGSFVFNMANGFSLLVFYVLAAQCLPTQAVTRRETGGWKWPAFQIAYMTGLAYLCALATHQVLSRVL